MNSSFVTEVWPGSNHPKLLILLVPITWQVLNRYLECAVPLLRSILLFQVFPIESSALDIANSINAFPTPLPFFFFFFSFLFLLTRSNFNGAPKPRTLLPLLYVCFPAGNSYIVMSTWKLSNVDKNGENCDVDMCVSYPVVNMLKSQCSFMAFTCGESEYYNIMIRIRICALERKFRELPFSHHVKISQENTLTKQRISPCMCLGMSSFNVIFVSYKAQGL